ncbi:hypothetical protein B0T11DRAFT_338568 [Plectosphaerella cucumerina]|uniref:Uncharacterized protein n=1 Tax=Plectosphaerella cucumerina TaxID=40658 RepID=A0A8K0THH9_9PEZI|nr:hypothetical protein B0T11DRAFT_338568 [Plectosphaerella cucumerina]
MELLQSSCRRLKTDDFSILNMFFFAIPILSAMGFGTGGMIAGSVAAATQSYFFGGIVPAGSWFATATSWGARAAWAA